MNPSAEQREIIKKVTGEIQEEFGLYSPFAKSIEKRAKDEPAGISFMITQQEKAKLRGLGYSDEEIRHMKPEEAHRALGLIS